jgi:predicted nucleotidyltransferase
MIDVEDRHLETIKRILTQYAAGCEVLAFGSRVDGTSRPSSDLDLAIVGEEKLDRRNKMLLREAFEESDLPFRVDVIDYKAVSDAFRGIIQKQCEILQPIQDKSGDVKNQ